MDNTATILATIADNIRNRSLAITLAISKRMFPIGSALRGDRSEFWFISASTIIGSFTVDMELSSVPIYMTNIGFIEQGCIMPLLTAAFRSPHTTREIKMLALSSFSVTPVNVVTSFACFTYAGTSYIGTMYVSVWMDVSGSRKSDVAWCGSKTSLWMFLLSF